MLEPLSAAEQQRVLGAMREIRTAFGGTDVATAPPSRTRCGPPSRRHGLDRPPPRRALLRRSTAGTSASRRSWRASSPTSSTTSIRRASTAGSPSGTERSSARSSSSPKRRPSPSCGCCSSSRRRAASASARAWSTRSSGSRATAGYKKIELWTHPELISARKIYKAAGFELIATETHQLFGAPLTAETWAMVL